MGRDRGVWIAGNRNPLRWIAFRQIFGKKSRAGSQEIIANEHKRIGVNQRGSVLGLHHRDAAGLGSLHHAAAQSVNITTDQTQAWLEQIDHGASRFETPRAADEVREKELELKI